MADKPVANDGKKLKVFPNNFEAEQSVLCCLLIDGNAVRNLVGKLESECFYNL